jgi:hypothetical protein
MEPRAGHHSGGASDARPLPRRALRVYDGLMIDDPRDRRAGPRYPCSRPTWWSGKPARPVGSPAWEPIALTGWLDEVYRAFGAPLPLELDPAPLPDATRAGG